MVMTFDLNFAIMPGGRMYRVLISDSSSFVLLCTVSHNIMYYVYGQMKICTVNLFKQIIIMERLPTATCVWLIALT